MGHLDLKSFYSNTRKSFNLPKVFLSYLPLTVAVCSITLFFAAHLLNLSTQHISFYVIIEFLSIFMAFSIALTLWYTYEYSQGFLQILGSSFLVIGFIKLFHALLIPGVMPQFTAGSSDQKALWFWAISRLLEAGALLFSGMIANTDYQIYFSRRFSFGVAIATSFLIFVAVSYSLPTFPLTLLTTNSIFFSTFIASILLLALFLFRRGARKTCRKGPNFMLCGIIASIFAELALAFHSSAGDTFNLLGHLYKLVSYTFMFHALFGQTVRQPFEEIEKLLNQTVTSISRALDRRDKYTYDHSARVADYALIIGQMMQVDRKLKENIRLSGLLHDIGKIAVPDGVLNKEGPLTAAEREMIKLHPVKGAEILEPIERLQVLRGISEHHERIDGKGYPLGISGEGISFEARIIAVADTFDAITSDRIYGPKKSKEEAMAILKSASGSQLDSQATSALILADKQGLIDPIMNK
ncbi:MAG: HD domain-containing phosphohydrolase [Eubacteriales bacterium]